MGTPNDLLTTRELDSLIIALNEGQGDFTESEAKFVIEWARKIRLNSIMLDFILKGTPDVNTHAVIKIVTNIDVQKNDVAFRIAKGACRRRPLEASR